MSGYLGEITKSWEATCAGCEQTALGLRGQKGDAAAELRQGYGWGTRGGFWNCRSCKDDPEMVNRRLKVAALSAQPQPGEGM